MIIEGDYNRIVTFKYNKKNEKIIKNNIIFNIYIIILLQNLLEKMNLKIKILLLF